MRRAVFVGEGTSDQPLGHIVARLFRRCGVDVDVAVPDFERLATPPVGVGPKMAAALHLTSTPIDLFVVHRDADTAGADARCSEIDDAMASFAPGHPHLPVVPVRMTEAWLLLDEAAIRRVAGRPTGRAALELPNRNEVERRADPKELLAAALLAAGEHRGRDRDRAKRRFGENRRRLLENLDIDGPVTGLASWQRLVDDVHTCAERWSSGA